MSKSQHHKDKFRPDKTLKRREDRSIPRERKSIRDIIQEEEDFNLWKGNEDDQESKSEDGVGESESPDVYGSSEGINGDSAGESSESGT